MMVGVDPATSELKGRQLDLVVVQQLVDLLEGADVYLREDGNFVVAYTAVKCGYHSNDDVPDLTFEIQNGLVESTYIDVSQHDMVLITPCCTNASCYEGCGCNCQVDIGLTSVWKDVQPTAKHCRLQAFEQSEELDRMNIERDALNPYWMSLYQFRRTAPGQASQIECLTGATGCGPSRS